MSHKLYYRYQFAVYHHNNELYKKCIDEIHTHLHKGEDIPFKLASDFFSIIDGSDMPEEVEFTKEYIEVLINAVTYFTNTHHGSYNVNGTACMKSEKEEVYVDYDLRDMFSVPIKEAIKLRNGQKNEIKFEEIIDLVYGLLEIYIETYFTEEERLKYKYYRPCVVSGYIVHLLGWKFTIKEKFVNDDIYQATKHILKHYKKEKPQ